MSSTSDKIHRKEEELREEAEGAPPNLDAEEESKATEEEKLDSAISHEVVRREGVKELNRSATALSLSGLAAGLAMGLSVLAIATLHHHLPESPWRSLVAALGYPLGFLVVTLANQELYTEHTVRPVVPLLVARTGVMLRKLLKLWGAVFIGNLVGAAVFAWAAARTAIFSPEIRRAIHTVALEGASHDWTSIFASGIVAGWLIALMVWMLPAASQSQVAVVVIMTWIVGAAKLSHVVIGAVETFYLTALGDLSIWSAFGGHILPAFLGNTVGGVILVAILNHAHVNT
jgi:formate/nitrite transporter FocA (FNT family)